MVLELKVRRVPLGTLRLAGGAPKGTRLLLDSSINCEKVVDLCFFFTTTLSVSVNIQIVGKDNETPGGDSFDIGDCMNLPPAGRDARGNAIPQRMSAPVSFTTHDVWHPYIGVDIYSQNPSTVRGELVVYAFVREWVNVAPGDFREQYDPRRSGASTFGQGGR